MSRLLAVIPAAGSGSRFGSSVAKQYLDIGGKSLLSWSIDAMLACEEIALCAVALPSQQAREAFSCLLGDRIVTCVGGASRAESVSAGIAALAAEKDDWVLVHDAARPCLNQQDLQSLVDAVRAREIGGLLAQRVNDTLKKVGEEQLVTTTVERSKYWRAQTPQMFRAGELTAAIASITEPGITDEASAMERAGYPVQVVEGSISNLKVTYPEDLQLAKFWLQQQGSMERNSSSEAT